jgi:hypothetical protein
MKKNLRILRPAIMLGIGLSLSVIGASLGPGDAGANLAAVALVQTVTPTPTPQAVSHVGSTDGIMLMSIIITIIILLPIVLRRNTWTR